MEGLKASAIVEYLVNKGYSLDVCNLSGQTPFEYAKFHKRRLKEDEGFNRVYSVLEKLSSQSNK